MKICILARSFKERCFLSYSNREDMDQTAHLCSLIIVFPVCIKSLLIIRNLCSVRKIL